MCLGRIGIEDVYFRAYILRFVRNCGSTMHIIMASWILQRFYGHKVGILIPLVEGSNGESRL